MPKAFQLLLILCGAVMLAPCFIVAQTPSATITGQVADPSRSILPQARVTAINNETNVKYSGVTNDGGTYLLTSLPPGDYRIQVEKTGFKTIIKPDVVLHVQDAIELNFEMALGSISETITVAGGAPILNTQNGSVSTVLDHQFVENMPLNGRSFQSLILLTPGTVMMPILNSSATTGQFSINGQRGDSNSVMVDGVSGNFSTTLSAPAQQLSGSLPGFTAFGSTQSLVSVDAMQEFRVQTSTYSAEYGRQAGGQISIVTRSGANQWHGSLYDYFRNDALDANDWFSDQSGQPKAQERQNDFGGTLGGPLTVPHVYNGHNRTFFLFSYEGLRLRLPMFSLTNVPTMALRQSAPAAVQPILNAFPLPNGRDLGNGLAEFNASYSNPATIDSTSIRIDHTIGQKWALFGWYHDAPSEMTTRSLSATSNSLITSVPTKTATVGVTLTPARKIVNDLRINYSRNYGTQTRTIDTFGGATTPPVTAFIVGPYDSGTATGGVTLNFPGHTSASLPSLTAFGGIGRAVESQAQFNLVDGVSWSMGPQQFKCGFDYRRLTPEFWSNTYSLSSIFASQQQVLSGIAGSASTAAEAKVNPIYTNYSLYCQDTWKASRRLTIDLGVRWDVNPSPGEANGNHPVAITEIDNLATAQLASPGTAMWKTTYANFAPRFGAAYSLRQQQGWETVLRGGFGVFYDSGNDNTGAAFGNYPFLAFKSITNVAYPLSAAQVAPPVLPTLSNLTPPYGTVDIYDPNLRLPYTLQWNVALQQSLGADQALTVSYVGAAGRRLLQQHAFSLGSMNPLFTTVVLTTNNATSDYDALQAQFQRRLSHGLQVLASYTWSHALDTDSADNGTILPVRGNAAFDARHIFSTAITYDIPAPGHGRAAMALFGKWSVDTSLHAQTALPVDVTGTSFISPLTGGFVAPRVNVVPGVPLYLSGGACTASNGGNPCPGGMRINPAAFKAPPAGTFGNLGRNVLRGFGAWQQDLAIRREFKVTEKLNLQFRAEAFNVFNHPNFGALQTTLTAANFGLATNMLNRQLGTGGLNQLYQIGGPRSLQLALKLRF